MIASDTTSAAAACVADLAAKCGRDAGVVADAIRRNFDVFTNMVYETLERERGKAAAKPVPSVKLAARAPQRPLAAKTPTKLHELPERQRRLARDLMNMAPATGGAKLSEAAAVARVVQSERQQALALAEQPGEHRRAEDEAVRRLMAQSGGFKTEAEARAAVQRMRSRFRK